MHKQQDSVHSGTYNTVAQCIEYLRSHAQQQPDLKQLSQAVGLSEYHLQRVFSDWVGVSPKQFLMSITKQQAKARLQQSSVLHAALDCGLSGSSRLHDLMIRCEGITPGEYKQQGKGLVIRYGFHDSPFGHCFLAVTQRGVCQLAFYDSPSDASAKVDDLQQLWAGAQLIHDQNETALTHQCIFQQARQLTGDDSPPLRLHVLMKGSPFQLQVWEALLAIPCGEIQSYQQVANGIGKPNAVRAVASAIAKNNVGYLIPCHRVIRGNGEFSQYRWGETRKQVLVGWELRNQPLA